MVTSLHEIVTSLLYFGFYREGTHQRPVTDGSLISKSLTLPPNSNVIRLRLNIKVFRNSKLMSMKSLPRSVSSPNCNLPAVSDWKCLSHTELTM